MKCNCCILLEQNTNKESRTERADSAQLGHGIPAVPDSKFMSQSNISYPIQMINYFLKGSKRVLKLKISHQSQAAQTSCAPISTILKSWLHASICNWSILFSLVFWLAHASHYSLSLSLQSICFLFFLNWPVCPSIDKNCEFGYKIKYIQKIKNQSRSFFKKLVLKARLPTVQWE